ncbi:hypothetical protein FBY35_5259 [Streptomyces sp. SLBN-118]|nr:hypothetical protein FBY35_5259 [Streptomyces sp. SLBN-118]
MFVVGLVRLLTPRGRASGRTARPGPGLQRQAHRPPSVRCGAVAAGSHVVPFLSGLRLQRRHDVVRPILGLYNERVHHVGAAGQKRDRHEHHRPSFTPTPDATASVARRRFPATVLTYRLNDTAVVDVAVRLAARGAPLLLIAVPPPSAAARSCTRPRRCRGRRWPSPARPAGSGGKKESVPAAPRGEGGRDRLLHTLVPPRPVSAGYEAVRSESATGASSRCRKVARRSPTGWSASLGWRRATVGSMV